MPIHADHVGDGEVDMDEEADVDVLDVEAPERRLAPRARPWALRAGYSAIYAAGGASLLLSLLSVWTIGVTGRFLYTRGGAEPRLELDQLPQYRELLPRGEDVLYLDVLPTSFRLLSLAPALVGGLTAMAAAALAVRLMRRIARGEPFSAEARRALTGLALVLVGGAISQGFLSTIATRRVWLLTGFDSPAFEQLSEVYNGFNIHGPTWPIATLLAGVVALVLRLAFAEGSRLEREGEGVV